MAQAVNIRDCKKAVNQAMYNPTKERKASAVKMLKALLAQVEALEEVKPAPKRKAKPKRMSKNTKLEVQAQRVSRGTAQTYVKPEPKPEPKVVATPEIEAYPEYAELRAIGYSVEDAVRYVSALMDGAPFEA